MTELENYLSGLRTFGVRPGYESTEKAIALLKECHSIKTEPKFLHIAGTNGKGSTCAFLYSILREANHKVGLFTSPHLVELRERIQIGGEMIGEKDFEKLALEVKDLGIELTFFEYLTVIAWLYFCERGVDYVVWETGLGGRLDATSAIKPFVTAITGIGLEHTQYLGNTIAEIAREKAGIIRPNVPLFHTADSEAKEVIEKEAVSLNAPCCYVKYEEGLIQPDKYFVSLPEIGIYNAQLGLLGHYQYKNAALAISIANYLNIDTISILNGVNRAVWPGRFQKLNKTPLTILDCAHNAQGWQALRESLEELRPGETWHVYFGMLAEKDPKLALNILAPIAEMMSYIEPQNERKLSLKEWRENVAEIYPGDLRFAKGFESAKEALDDIRTISEGNIIICGSCYMAGEILAILGGRVRDNSKDDPVGRK